MLINCDVKSLEVVVAAELSNDTILKDELRSGANLHRNNQERFGLPTRVVAKRFIFKLLYGATAYGYAVDTDFLEVGFSEKQWQRIIDEFYSKYKGIAVWHNSILRQVRETGQLEIPSGRIYRFKPELRGSGPKWPTTKIKNYPVQGFGADLVLLARVEFYNKFLASGLAGDFIATVHDSLVVDTIKENVYNISLMLKDAVESVPRLCKEYWNYDFSLPLTCEIQVGPNKRDMEELVL